MTKKDTALVAAALADVERTIEDVGDAAGIGASTLRLVVDSVGAAIAAESPRFKKGHFEMDAMPISHARVKHAILTSTAASWPYNDVVATGVLDTVVARRDTEAYRVYEWASKLGKDRFYEILADGTGDAEVFFVELAEQDDAKDFDYDEKVNYDRNVGPAVDRIEDAFTAREAVA